MSKLKVFLSASIALICASLVSADVTLPLVDADYPALQRLGERLLQALDALKQPVSKEKSNALASLLHDGGKDPAAAVEAIQKQLDALCLVQVSINPESRVKAVRGPARAELALAEEKAFLIKVHNEAGVTHPLMIGGDAVRGAKPSSPEAWLRAEVYAAPPLRRELSGQKLEYVIVRLTAREAGKREATLKFDVGQGTQDLGFRAEVPILFTVRSK
jgi:hypothetical protein